MAATNGLDWLTNPSSELFQEKEAAPGYTIPAGLTAQNVPDADDFNGLQNASKVMRTAILTPLVELDVPFENYLKNTQWQLMTNVGYGPKYKADGTGVESAITVASYSVTTNTATCQAANTGSLKAGDLVEFSAAAHANLKVCPCRVNTGIVVNTSFPVGLPRGTFGTTTAACTAQQVDAGGTNSAAGTDGPDGWTKPVGPEVWREDNAVNIYPGSRFSCAYKKSDVNRQDLTHPIEAKDLQKFLGKTVVFGVGVKQGIKGGTGTWRAVITVDGSDTFSDPSDSTSFQWREVTATVASGATSVSFAIAFEGNSGDVYYVTQPMAGAGNYIGSFNYTQARGESFEAIRSITLAPYNSASITFPVNVANTNDPGMPLSDITTALGGNVGTDWAIRLRITPESYGAVASTVRQVRLQTRARSATLTRYRLNSFFPLRVTCVLGGTRGTATFKISADSFRTASFTVHSSTQASSGATMSWPSGTYSGDANNNFVHLQVINVGNGGTYVANDTWTFSNISGTASSIGTPTFAGSGYNGITITPVVQNVQWGIRSGNVVSPVPVESQFAEAKVASAMESQTTWTQLEANGDCFLYGSSTEMPLTEMTLSLNGFVLA